MIDPAGRLHRPATADGIVSITSRSQPPESQSFAAELSDKLASTLQSVAQSAELRASLPASQQSATRRDAGGASASTSGSTPGSKPSAASQPLDLINGFVINYPDTTSGASSAPAAAAATPVSFDSAYWAQQPAAVQQLQDIQNPAQRTQVAEQLAHEGYSIDVPIMVWGWDPQVTTQLRQSLGYTWVPSALQQPIEVAPGLSFNGQSYNPANPPAGSITV
jgi:hypothetical protein